tara:strand:+ start:179 stop:556 length:378 start_codon:yes stop_codon:yes gene_type:complete
MKITKTQLKQIIKEEIEKLDELGLGAGDFGPMDAFEKLGELPDEDLRRVMSSVDIQDLAMSLAKGQATDQLVDRIVSQVAPRAQGQFQNLIDRYGSAGSGPYFVDGPRQRSAQHRILSAKKKLGL